MSYIWLWRYVNLAKNHDFEEFSFQELVNSGQQNNVDQSCLGEKYDVSAF